MKVKPESEVAQSCPTLSNPMDGSLPVSSVHGFFQARVLERGAIAFSKSVLLPHPKSISVISNNSCFSVLVKGTVGYLGPHVQATHCFLVGVTVISFKFPENNVGIVRFRQPQLHGAI